MVLGHNYMEPLVFNLSSRQEQGDSLGLSQFAAATEAEYIIFNGVRFMAETAKVLSPEKRVLISDKEAGCSLADDFDPTEIDRLRELHPGAPVMIYINSYADAKARCDITCTSANSPFRASLIGSSSLSVLASFNGRLLRTLSLLSKKSSAMVL